MKIKNLVIKDLQKLNWDELKETIYNELLTLTIDQVWVIKRKVLKKINEDRVKENEKKIYKDVNQLLMGNIRNKDYIQNKERYDEHTDYMLNKLSKDLTTSKNFHLRRERELKTKNPELATYHMRMWRALNEQGY